MNRYLSLRAVTAVAAAVALLCVALLVRRPALAAVAVAVAAPVGLGVVLWRRPELDIEVGVSAARVVEGDVVQVLVTVAADTEVAWLDVEYEPAPGLDSVDGILRRIVTVPEGMARVIAFEVKPSQWGVLATGRLRVVVRDRFGLFALATIRSLDAVLRVYPAEARLRSLATPARTGSSLGAHLAAVRGDGCEYADVRPWQPGDRRRAINWRVSARRGATWVSDRHPERSADVVLLLDDTAALGPGDDTTLRRAVQAAMTLAENHLLAQDKVGLLAVGAPLRWLAPRSGTRQLYAIVDTLLDCRLARLSGLGRQPALVAGGLRPGTTVVGLTLLADDRIVEVLGELRRHGHHVVAVEPATPPPAPGDSRARLAAMRLWNAERAARRERLLEAGVVSLRWDEDVPLRVLLARVGRPAALSRTRS